MLAICLFFLALNLAVPSSVTAQDIEWQYDIKSGISKAEADNKLVLLHFSASWCRPCQALDKFVFPNLEVARSVNENVVPVHIDVDKNKALVTEYGVTAVPFDVIITPGGRVIAKQKSPLDSNGYRRMMAGLSTPVKELEDQSKVAIAQKLNEFSDQFNFKPPQISKFKDHTPAAPTHQAPAPSSHSAQLARQSSGFTNPNRISNPFFGEAEATPKPAPKAVSNSFAVTLDDALQTPAAKTVSMTTSDFEAGSQKKATQLAATMPNELSLKPPAEEIKLEPPVIKSEYEVITGAEVEQAALAKHKPLAEQKAFNEIAKIAPKVSPKMSFEANSGPQLSKLMQPNAPTAKAKGLAESVPPLQVQQDRFFQAKADPAPKNADQTRVVAPSNSAQALLKPIHQIAQRAPVKNAANAPAQATRAQQLLQPQASVQPQPSVQPNIQPQAVISKSTVPSEPSLGLKGKCPVTLLQEGKWVQGNAKFGCIHRDRLYMFANAQKLEMFKSNPDYFSPILAGYDPVVFHQEGRLVNGLAQHGVFMGKAPNQRVLLFRDAQTRALFQAEPTAYMNTVRQAMNATSGANASTFR